MSKSKRSKSKALDVDGLLAHTLGAMAEVHAGAWRQGESKRIASEVVAAIEVCLEAERVDLAVAIAEGVPAPQRGRALLHLALAGHYEVESAVDAILEGVGLVEPGAGACLAATFALESAKLLGEKTKRTQQLIDAAGSVVDACFESGSTYDLAPVALAYMALNERETVKSMLSRADRLPDGLAAVVRVLESPSKILPLVNRSNADQALGSVWADIERWSVEQIAQLADCAMGTWARPVLAEKLMALGRQQHAKELVIDDPAWDQLMLTWKAERYMLVGEPDEAKRVLSDNDPPTDELISWMRMQREFGLRTFDDFWPLAAKREPEGSVMAPIQKLTALIGRELDRGTSAEVVSPAVDAIGALFADPFRTQYDRGVEGARRNDVATLRARLQMATGERAAAAEQVVEDFANIKDLFQYAKDSYAKSRLLTSFASRATMVGRSDIALKAAMKIPKTYRAGAAPAVALGFLPGAPADALAAVNRLAKDKAAKVVLDGKGLLAALWKAVLSPAP